jgi:hypothetical protein
MAEASNPEPEKETDMKTTTETPSDSKGQSPAAKAAASRSRKAMPRKASAKRPAAAARKPPSAAAGYGDTAAKFIARGKSAFGDAYAWAEEAGSALPRRARGLGLPDQTAMQHYFADRPLVLGAVGLGIGMALGAMMPSAIGGRPAKPDGGNRPAARGKARRK